MTSMSSADMCLRLAVALVLGGLVGLEREWTRKPAGLRTHIMVSMGAATFTVLVLEMFMEVSRDNPPAVQLDPMRLFEGIIGGIGFLGAGSIIRSGGSVEGLTTAGSLWFVGAVGIACGTGEYLVAVYAIALGLLVLQGLGWVERRFLPDRPEERGSETRD